MRLQVRKSVYRGDDGWTLSGQDGHGRRVRVFFVREDAARRTRDKLVADPDSRVELEDFA